MPRPRRLCFFAKYTGLALCFVVFVAWFVSRWREVEARHVSPIKNAGMYGIPFNVRAYRVAAGAFTHYRYQYMRPPNSSIGWNVYEGRLPHPQWIWLPSSDQRSRVLLDDYFVLPLWIPFLLFALPTTLFFYLDRRAPHNHCPHCRYDLRGNTTGLCPECGHTCASSPKGNPVDGSSIR